MPIMRFKKSDPSQPKRGGVQNAWRNSATLITAPDGDDTAGRPARTVSVPGNDQPGTDRKFCGASYFIGE